LCSLSTEVEENTKAWYDKNDVKASNIESFIDAFMEREDVIIQAANFSIIKKREVTTPSTTDFFARSECE
jgi:hypothetical protein